MIKLYKNHGVEFILMGIPLLRHIPIINGSLV
nr:MAG TPA: hypothetical protein [Caudoviricetes sp.]